MSNIIKSNNKYMDEPMITAPEIDKLSAVVDVVDKKLFAMAYSNALSWHENHELGVTKISSKGKYKLNVKIQYPDHRKLIYLDSPFILLQLTSAKASKPQLRIEYNPRDMCEEGEDHLDVMFTELLGLTFYELLFHARFTRIDFHRNILFRNMEDYLIRAKYSKVSQCFFGTDGKLQTINFGKSGNNQIIVYDKTKQLHGDKAAHSTIRVEARCHINCKISALAKFSNPLDRVVIYSGICEKPPFGEAHWLGFVDSCRLRGIGNATKNQPYKNRNQLKKSISENPVNWWQLSDDNWSYLLISALENAGLTNIPDYAPPLSLKYLAGEDA